MKTIDLLVQELPDLGGWPEGAVDASFFIVKIHYIFLMEMEAVRLNGVST